VQFIYLLSQVMSTMQSCCTRCLVEGQKSVHSAVGVNRMCERPSDNHRPREEDADLLLVPVCCVLNVLHVLNAISNLMFPPMAHLARSEFDTRSQHKLVSRKVGVIALVV
jgi:hypothetical protein